MAFVGLAGLGLLFYIAEDSERFFRVAVVTVVLFGWYLHVRTSGIKRQLAGLEEYVLRMNARLSHIDAVSDNLCRIDEEMSRLEERVGDLENPVRPSTAHNLEA